MSSVTFDVNGSSVRADRSARRLSDMLVPPGAFGYVPTPALVAPLEFTLRRDDYAALGGHMEAIVPMDEILARPDVRYS